VALIALLWQVVAWAAVIPPVICAAVSATVLAAAPGGGAQYSKLSTVDLVQTQLTVPKNVTPGKRFVVLDTVENAGETSSPMTISGFCLARTDVCAETDLRFAARRVPALDPGASHSSESPVMLPGTVEPGRYFLIVTANANKDVEERNRNNNTRASVIDVTPKK
jgi:hypothetical protein